MDESTKPVKTLNSLIHVAEVEPFINEGQGPEGRGQKVRVSILMHKNATRIGTLDSS